MPKSASSQRAERVRSSSSSVKAVTLVMMQPGKQERPERGGRGQGAGQGQEGAWASGSKMRVAAGGRERNGQERA